jgi:uncharacterized protein
VYSWLRKLVAITYDPVKRASKLEKHGLDFEDAAEVFAGRVVTLEDGRQDYGEKRYRTFGLLRGRLIIVVWTPRGEDQHVFSMRKCNAREQKALGERLGAVGRDDG